MSDAPSGLIELNALDRNLANGCRNWVDVTGRTYFGVDRGNMSRRTNLQWQHDLRSYLLSGDAVFLVRVASTGLNAATLRIMESGDVLDRADGYRVYRVGVRANVTASHQLRRPR